MNKYHIAQSYQSLLDFYGENHQSYRHIPDTKSTVSVGGLNFCSISKNKIVVFGKFEGKNYKEALERFSEEVNKWLPKIVFMTQTSVEKWYGIACYKEGEDRAILERAIYRNVGNSFYHGKDLPVLKDLDEQEVPEEFYVYWTHASMIHNYAGKLSLMLFALEALAKSGREKHQMLEEILGKDLKEKAWKLRNQLAHGDHYESKVLYTDIHKKTIKYFNKNILKTDALTENMVLPQRGSGSGQNTISVIRSKTENLDVVKILKNIDTKDTKLFTQGSAYDIVPDHEIDGFLRNY